MKYIIMFLMSLSAHAVTIEQAVDNTNQKVRPNPWLENSEGYEVEYREEMNYAWININKVTYKCKKEIKSFISHGNIETKEVNTCTNWHYGTMDALYQISCDLLALKPCKKALAEELSAVTIKKMVEGNIHQLYIKGPT